MLGFSALSLIDFAFLPKLNFEASPSAFKEPGRFLSDSNMLVSTMPGHRTDTPMSSCSRSSLKVSEMPTTAYLEAVYIPILGSVI